MSLSVHKDHELSAIIHLSRVEQALWRLMQQQYLRSIKIKLNYIIDPKSMEVHYLMKLVNIWKFKHKLMLSMM